MEVVIEDYRQNVLQNQAITGSGASGVFTDFGSKELNLVVNVTGPVTGGSPTIQFFLQEVDPGDGATNLGSAKSTQVITGTGVFTATLPVMFGGSVKVTWTVTGSTPSFGGVYATILNKIAGTSVLYDSSGNPVFGTAGAPGSAVLTVQGISGGQPSPVSGTVTATQGTAAALAGYWPVRVTDGTNTLPTMDAVGRAGFQKLTDGTNTAAVKAASTAAVAADPALVVAISPNNTVAVTGTVTATNPSVGTNNAAIPTSSTQVGGTDMAGLLQALTAELRNGRAPLIVRDPDVSKAMYRVVEALGTLGTFGNHFLGSSRPTQVRQVNSVRSISKSVLSSASAVIILEANTARRGATVFNDSNAILYLNLDDSQASTTNFTARLVPNAYYEMPFHYAGPISGIWASANGSARITEFY